MEFSLFYAGPLPSNGNPDQKQLIRRALHKQLLFLWEQEPLAGIRKFVDHKTQGLSPLVTQTLGPFRYLCLVTDAVKMFAEIDFVVLWPDPSGSILRHGGDIDNRLKTLFDALSMPPHLNQIPPGDKPQADEDPFYCLLEDDKLITRINVRTDRLLDKAVSGADVRLFMHVRTKPISLTAINSSM